MGRQKILLGIILFLLMLPLLQQKLGLIKMKELNGSYTKATEPTFSFDSLLQGSFQKEAEKYLNENFGFRNFFVRVNNQLAFYLYNISKANYVTVGKDNYLFDIAHIDAYYGKDFIGEDAIHEKLRKLKLVQDTLKKKNIDLILIYALGKGSYYPEFIPDKFKTEKKQRNIDCYLKWSKQLGINHIDFNTYYVQQKSKSPYLLFPQLGIHWSTYATLLALDSIGKYIDHLRKIDIPDLRMENMVLSDQIDNDVAEGMNLLFPIPCVKVADPKKIIINKVNKTKPKLLSVGDSYYWTMVTSGNADQMFNEPEFWYYYQQLHQTGHATIMDRSAINLKQEIEKQDVILIIGTEPALTKIGWGFIEDVYKLYYPESSEYQINSNQEKGKNRMPINLCAVNGKFVCADKSLNNQLIADRESAGSWESFTLVLLENNDCAICSNENLFFCAELNDDNRIAATRQQIGEWETFSMIKLDSNYVAFKAANGKYMSIDERSNQIYAKGISIGKLEKFKLVSKTD